jgi:alpha-tubulin suppressor-like RCC1 family protein
MHTKEWFRCVSSATILLVTSCATYGQSFGEALDATNLTWTTSGLPPNAIWTAQTNTSHDGMSAAQGAFLVPGWYSFLQTTVDGPATVSFWWKASQSRIMCIVAGIQQASILAPTGANDDWRQQTIYVGPGPQSVQWLVVCDGNVAPSPTGWLDEVRVLPGNSAPIITSQPVSQSVPKGLDAMLRVEAVGTLPIQYQWQRNDTNIPGATAASLLLTDVQPDDYGTYRVVLANVAGTNVSSDVLLEPGEVAAWGGQSPTQIVVPIAGSNTTAISAAGLHSVALRLNGTVIAWGDNSYAQTLVPLDLHDVAALAATPYHNLALRTNGTVKTWGCDVRRTPGLAYGPWVNPTSQPPGWTNVVGIAGGEAFIMGLNAEGKVMVSGLYLPTESTITWITMPAPTDLTNAVAISAGRNHALALKADGTVAAWGRNYETQTNTPVGLSNVIAVAAGDYHSLALKADGTVIGWGAYYAGQSTPPAGLSNVVAIAAGNEHSIALKGDGTVVTWGTNRYGQTMVPVAASNVVAIAAGSYHNVALERPGQRSPFLTTPLVNRAAAAAGEVHFYALATGEQPLFYQWQFNGTNLPGDTTPILRKTNVKPEDAGLYSVIVTNNYGAATSSVASLVIYDFKEALNTSNVVWTAGGVTPWFVQTGVTHDGAAAAQSGAISDGGSSYLRAELIGPATLVYWWKVSSQTNRDYLTVKVGNLVQDGLSGEVNWRLLTNYVGLGSQVVEWTYAKDASGSSGQDAAWLDEVQLIPKATAPIIVTDPTSRSQCKGMPTTFFVNAVGTPPLSYQWLLNGTNLSGAAASSLSISNVQSLDLGAYSVVVSNPAGMTTSSLARLTFGNIAAWGEGSSGQTLIPPDLTNALAIAGGLRHSVALRSDGTVIAWGANELRQCQVPQGLTNVIAIASHLGNHTLALKTDGKVVAWGDNRSFQTNVPASVSNVVAIAAGNRHSLALRANGTVVQWGNASVSFDNLVAVAGGTDRSFYLRADGRLTASPNVPFLPPGLTNISAVGPGNRHALALRQDGTVFAWGNNPFGQTDVPAGLDGVVAVAAGSNHSIVLRADGAVVGWGAFTIGDVSVPAAPVEGLTNVIAISAGADFALALLSDTQPLVQTHVLYPHWSDDTFTISLPTQSGFVYRMEYKTSPTDTAWLALELVPGTWGHRTLIDPTATNSLRIYQIRRW